VIQLSITNLKVPLKIEYPAASWLTVAIYVAGLTNALDLDLAAVLVCLISILQAQSVIESFVTQTRKGIEKCDFKVKSLIYPVILGVICLVFCLYQVVDCMQQECDFTTDAILIGCLGLMWLTQPRHLRKKDLASNIAIALCIKITYFVDSQSSLNFKTDSELIDMKL
jgi:hypothetical protein